MAWPDSLHRKVKSKGNREYNEENVLDFIGVQERMLYALKILKTCMYV